MRRLLACLVVVVGVSLSLPVAIPLDRTQTLHAAQNAATITVYITKTGEKYHRDGCQYLSRSKIATTLKEALARGFGPCKVCKPPTAR
jgi:hypothetical protein